jgi:YesN/AraC family two-component response regulator
MPIFIGSFVYVQILDVAMRETNEKNSIILEQSRDVIDGYMSSVESTIHQLASDSRIINLMQVSGSIGGMNMYTAFELQKDFSTVNTINDFISTFYFYLKDSNIIITKDTIYFNPELYYRIYFDTHLVGYNAWLNRLASVRNDQSYIYEHYNNTSNFRQNVITSLQSIPVNNIGSPKGCIAILINEGRIRMMLDPISTDKGGWFYIMDGNGNILSSTHREGGAMMNASLNFLEAKGTKLLYIQNKKMIVTYTSSSKNNWRYVSVIPFSVVMGKVEYVRNITIIITVLILLAGVVIAFVAAYHSNKPIKRIIGTISEKLGTNMVMANRNEYEILEGNLISLIDSNEQLKRAMQDQAVLVKATFFERLIKGQYRSLEELDAIAKLSGNKISGNYYAVVMIQFVGFIDMIAAEYLDELEKKRVLAKNIICRYVNERGLVHDVENDKTMLLLSFMSADEVEVLKEIAGLIEGINYELFNSMKSRFVFGIGNPYISIIDIYKSFNEAYQALDFRVEKPEENLFWYCKIPWGSGEFFFPMETQARLFYLVKAGEKEAVNILLDEIFNENFVCRKLSEEMTKLLMNDMCATCITIKSKLKIKEDNVLQDTIIKLNKLFGNNQIKEWYDSIRKNICSLCDIVAEQKKNYNSKLVDEVTRFINLKYTDPQLSLSVVALKFGFTEANLSLYFKERTGDNLSTYVENLRIEHACRLLENRSNPVYEIAGLVGYNSDHSFRRAFKRIKCISPTDYRKEIFRSQ